MSDEEPTRSLLIETGKKTDEYSMGSIHSNVPIYADDFFLS